MRYIGFSQAVKREHSDTETAETNWEEIYAMLLVNTSMNIEQINCLSFPVISAMIKPIMKISDRKNGIIYDDETEIGTEETSNTDVNTDNQNGVIPLTKDGILDYYSRIGTLQIN